MLKLSLKILGFSSLVSISSIATASNQHALLYTELISNTSLSAINGNVSCKKETGEETLTPLTLENSLDHYQDDFSGIQYDIHTLELPDGKNQMCELKILEVKFKNLVKNSETSYKSKNNNPFVIKINSMNPILLKSEENEKIFEADNSTETNQKISISANIFVDPKNQTITPYSPPHIGINYHNPLDENFYSL